MARICLSRSNEFAYRHRKLTIILNDKSAGKIGAGATQVLTVRPGRYRLAVRLGPLSKSRELLVEIHSDEEVLLFRTGATRAGYLPAPGLMLAVLGSLILSLPLYWFLSGEAYALLLMIILLTMLLYVVFSEGRELLYLEKIKTARAAFP